MAQRFAQFETLISDEAERQFGEQISVHPLGSEGEFLKKTADATRPPATVIAIVDFEPKMLKSRFGGRNDADTPDLIGEKIHVSVRETALPYTLRDGDVIVFLERAEPYPTRVIVSTSEPDGIGRVLYRCKPGSRA